MVRGVPQYVSLLKGSYLFNGKNGEQTFNRDELAIKGYVPRFEREQALLPFSSILPRESLFGDDIYVWCPPEGHYDKEFYVVLGCARAGVECGLGDKRQDAGKLVLAVA